VVIAVGAVMGIVLRRHRGDAPVRLAVMVVNALLVLQVAAGALVVIFSLPAAMRALHLALASALWAAVVAVAVFTRTRAEVPAREGDAAGIARLNARTGVVTS
jgi:heme A synthase